ncbi:MAG: hypothetical protein ACP5E3_04935 [Bacteroidales bacterium]
MKIDGNATRFTTDIQSNIYFIEDKSFVRINPDSKCRREFDFKYHGNNLIYDVSNPNYFALYFKDSRKVVLLDSNLNKVVRPFYIEEVGLYEISHVLASSDRSLWFYNFDKNYLVKLNQDFIPVVKTETLFDLSGKMVFPNFFSIFTNEIYINLPASGILVLDYTGRYKTFYNLTGLVDFQVIGGSIYYYRDRLIHRFDRVRREKFEIEIPEVSKVINAHYHSDRIIIQTPGSILVFSR